MMCVETIHIQNKKFTETSDVSIRYITRKPSNGYPNEAFFVLCEFEFIYILCHCLHINLQITCDGTAISPTDTPHISLPAKRQVTFFEKPMISQPMHRGIDDNWRLPRLPIASRSGPDNSEPTGVARL